MISISLGSSDFRGRHAACIFHKGVGEYDMISETEKIENPYLLSREFDPEFMNPIGQEICIGSGEVGTPTFKL